MGITERLERLEKKEEPNDKWAIKLLEETTELRKEHDKEILDLKSMSSAFEKTAIDYALKIKNLETQNKQLEINFNPFIDPFIVQINEKEKSLKALEEQETKIKEDSKLKIFFKTSFKGLKLVSPVAIMFLVIKSMDDVFAIVILSIILFLGVIGMIFEGLEE